MSKIEKLIPQLCPNGVEYKKMSELGFFYNGLSGKSKEDFKDGNAKFITYKNIYSNISLRIDVNDSVKIGQNEKQKTIEYGDVLFTGSSETQDECGFSSVVTQRPKEKLYLNSFCFGFRLFDDKIYISDFLKHLFRSKKLRYQIEKTASGVTRFNVSKAKMAKIVIPVPPLPIQQEIVRILDKFSSLTTELQTELQARKSQYEYYRNQLLSFSHTDNLTCEPNNNVKWMNLGDICNNIYSGGTPNTARSDYYGGSIPWLRTQEINFNEIGDTDIKITKEGLNNSSAKWINANCVIVAMYGATVGKIGINKIRMTTNQACCNLEINPNIAKYKYIFHYLSSIYGYIKSLGQGSQTNINAKIIKDLLIPIPPLSEQARIVSILDRFDKLCNDLSEGLPAEIKARQKQYEYYCNKLLTFKEKA